MNIQVADAWKEGLARLMRRWPLNELLSWGVRTMVPRQRVGVALVAFNSNEEIFLLRHVFHPSAPWGLPGGWLNRDEAPASGLARELREETGLDIFVGPTALVGYETEPPHIVLAYLGWIRPGPIRLSGEILEARWFPAGQLPDPLWPFARRAIDEGLSRFRATPHPPAGVLSHETIALR